MVYTNFCNKVTRNADSLYADYITYALLSQILVARYCRIVVADNCLDASAMFFFGKGVILTRHLA